MSTLSINLETALSRYNRLFNNANYNVIAALLAADLQAERDSAQVSDAMNLVTDASLALCGSHSHRDGTFQLAVFCGRNPITRPTIAAIAEYLLKFESDDQHVPNDFEGIASGLLSAYKAKDHLNTSAAYANGIHSWHGRMAYELLVAAEYLTQAATGLLLHDGTAYIHEKLQYALHRLTSALYEGIRHSETPTMFEFRGTYFPKEGD